LRFLVASSSAPLVIEASRLLGGVAWASVRQGTVTDLGAGCAAGLLHFKIAQDRYGGTPVNGRAQVLRNTTGDGAPPIILATPPAADIAFGCGGHGEVENQAARILRLTLGAWARSPLYRPVGPCLLHLESAGLDFGPLDAVLRGVRRAIESRH
jgi:hypothetical protein